MGSEGGAGVRRRRAGRAEGPGEWGGEGREARGGGAGEGGVSGTGLSVLNSSQ